MTIVGVPALFVSVYLMNLLAFASGRFARAMLAPPRDVWTDFDIETEIEEAIALEIAA